MAKITVLPLVASSSATFNAHSAEIAHQQGKPPGYTAGLTAPSNPAVQRATEDASDELA